MSKIKEQIREFALLKQSVTDLQAQIAELQELKKETEARMLEIMDDMKAQMQKSGMNRAIIAGWKINLSHSTATVIEAEDEIPEEFWKIERKPNVMMIKDALKTGIEVPGAKLVRNVNINLKQQEEAVTP